MKSIVCFGEILTRFSSPGFSRLRQAIPGTLEVRFAGAEANIAATIALLGGQSRMVSTVPSNVVGDSAIQYFRSLGVDCSAIRQTDLGRMGTYYIETGAAQRASTVLYDREHSAFSLAAGNSYPWHDILSYAAWLMVSGIGPAVSATAAEATLYAVRAACRQGVSVCCDLNFRSKLWQWEPETAPKELARREMANLMPFVDVVLTNPEQAHDVLGIPWDEADRGNIEAYVRSARAIAAAFPHLNRVVFTMRESFSATHNAIGALLLDVAQDKIYLAPECEGVYEPYDIAYIVDRVGAGDAFAGGLLYALSTEGLDDSRTALSFAIAASCLAHSVPGDIPYVSRQEVEALMRGNRSGRIIR